MPKVSSRRLALAITGIALILMTLGGIFQTSTTDAAWTDEQAASGSFRQLAFEGAITGLQCARDNQDKPNTIKLSWEEPADLQGMAVEYEVSWQDDKHPDFRGVETVTETHFGPYFPEAFPAQHANLTFTIQARVPGTELRGAPQEIYAHGPVGSDVVIRCGQGGPP